MAIEEAYEQSLNSARPAEQLYAYVKGLLEQGYERDSILADLEALFVSLQEQGRETEQEAVADVLDCLTNWCAPGLAI
jgi:secreted trypsin-like serine protease